MVGIAGNQLADAERQLRAAGFETDFIASCVQWKVSKTSSWRAPALAAVEWKHKDDEDMILNVFDQLNAEQYRNDGEVAGDD